jgi:hypothetical protein
MKDDDHRVDHGTGLTGGHRGAPAVAHRVAPTAADEHNTIRLPLVPVACFRIDDVVFSLGTSLVGPGFEDESRKLGRLLDDNPGARAAIFAHAEPGGDDADAKRLSDRRARAIFGALTRRWEIWDELYLTPVPGDDWTLTALQTILATIVDPADWHYYHGPPDGLPSLDLLMAIQCFQMDNGLLPTGLPDVETRKALYLAYMSWVCIHEQYWPLVLSPENFLMRGQGPGGKGDYQGCSGFNPIVVRAQEYGGSSVQGGAPAQFWDRPNSRVVLYLFPADTEVSPGDWPCPRAGEGADACRGAFWPGGAARPAQGEQTRKYPSTRDTMACRFYDRFARRSPCEGSMGPSKWWIIRLTDDDGKTPVDRRKPLAREPWVVPGAGPGGADLRGVTDADGVLRIPVRRTPCEMRLLVYGVEITLLGDELCEMSEGDEAIRQRLSNLGFGRDAGEEPSAEAFAEHVKRFQRSAGIAESGEICGATRAAVEKIHGG